MQTHRTTTKVCVDGFEISLVREFDEETERFEEYVLARHPRGCDRFTDYHPILPALIRGLSGLIAKVEAVQELEEEAA